MYLGGTDELRYAWWDNTTWRFERVDSWSRDAFKASLALDSKDVPHVAYFDRAFWDLKYAVRVNGTWNVEAVDEYGDVGRQPSIAIDSHDVPHISYIYISGPSIFVSINYAVRNGTSWDIETVTDRVTYDIGDADTSLAFNSTDDPRIAFGADQIAYYAYRDPSGWKIEPIHSNPGDSEDAHYPEMALDSSEVPHIIYSRSGTATILEHAVRTPMGWVVEEVDPTGGFYHSIAIDSRDRLHITYTNSLHGIITPEYLYYAFGDISWTLDTIDTQEGVGYRLSTAIDGCDDIHVSYTHIYSGVVELRYANLPGQDVTPPKSAASLPGPYWRNTSPVVIEANVSDSCSGVSNITLWYRHSNDNSTWGAWTQYSNISSPPWTWSFTFPAGEGHYEFYTTAVDGKGNAESAPFSADAIAGYDATPPFSIVDAITPYWQVISPITIDASAGDAISGVDKVTMWYRYSSDNTTWGSWALFQTDNAGPWSWSFDFPDADGFYEFYSLAIDNASNSETKAVADERAGFSIVVSSPPSNLSAFLSGIDFEDVTLTWNLSPDDGSGKDNVIRYDIYRGSVFDPSGSLYSLHTSLPPGTSVFADAQSGEGDPSNYFYLICAVSFSDLPSCTLNQAGKFTRPLSEGMNLISIPLVQKDESVTTVLQTVKFDKAWTYDSSISGWKWFTAFKPYSGELKSINETQGFWVNVTNECNYTVAGVVPIKTTLHLHEGWNLIGFPSFHQDYTVADLKADVTAERIEGYDASTPPYFLRLMLEGDILGTGYAYWLNVAAETTWTVRNE